MVDVLDPQERVVLAEDLAGVAEGTSGEVVLHTGLHWIRYRVRFDSGAERGSIHRDKLVREANWADFSAERAAAAIAATMKSEELVESATEEPAEASAGSEAVVNGVAIPSFLLERSSDARTRLTT